MAGHFGGAEEPSGLGVGAQGTTTIDFGAFPGASDAMVTVTGQASIVAGSLVEVWLRPIDTADHTADEHMVEHIKVFGGNIIAGTGFTAYAFYDGSDGIIETPQQVSTAVGALTLRRRYNPTPGGRLYGVWNLAWAWN